MKIFRWLGVFYPVTDVHAFGQDKVDIGLAKLTQEGNNADCWVVFGYKGATNYGPEEVTPSEAQDLIDDAGTYNTWATTASGILDMWDSLSTSTRHALHYNCERHI